MPTPIRKGSTALIEQPNSPRWNFGEQVSCVRTFMATSYDIALASAPMRGAVGTGIVSGYRVSASQVERVRGGAGSLSISYENFPGTVPGQGSQLPADEAEIVFEKLEHPIRRIARYEPLSSADQHIVTTLLESLDDTTATEAAVKATQSPNELLIYELLEKLRRGETHKLLYTPVYRLQIHSWTAPLDLDPGGYLDTPPNFPIVPPQGNEWLREGDRLSFNGTLWVQEKRWLGAPEWDHDIYPVL
jgi:hypothetical protein